MTTHWPPSFRDCNCFEISAQYSEALTVNELAVCMGVSVDEALAAPGWCKCGRFLARVSCGGRVVFLHAVKERPLTACAFPGERSNCSFPTCDCGSREGWKL